MGRRAARRRLKKRHGKRNSKENQRYYSDPEDCCESSGIENRGRKWDSLDDLTAIDYVTNADPSTIREEMDVTRRLSSLNVSVACCSNDPCTVMTSDVETIYSEFPPSATFIDNLPGEFMSLERLKERQYRKRSSKRNRKRTKKAKALSCSNEDSMAGKQRRPSQASSKLRFNPIAWVHPLEDSSVKYPSGVDLFEANQFSDVSSRALTDSESPTLDDIIMIESCQEDEELGVASMEALELGSFISSSPPLSSFLTSFSTNVCSQDNSESELTETSSSGCDGDDEESSVEVSGSLKVHGIPASSSLRRGFKTNRASNMPGVEDGGGFSSADEVFNEPSASTGTASTDAQWLPRNVSIGTGFKHPQQWGIKGGANLMSISPAGQNKQKKKVVPVITSPQDLSNRMKQFVQFSVELELVLPLMSRALCRTANSLADVHNLECFVHQKRRLPVASPVLRKTCCTRLASDSEIEEVLRNHHKEVLNSVLRPKKIRRSTTRLPVQVPVSLLSDNVLLQKTLVGHDAPPINESNIGNQILRGMGWKPGNGLGAQENGIQEPVFAEIRPKTAGLGYA